MQITRFVFGTAIIAIAGATAVPARANLALEFIQGANTTIITDNGVGDTNSAVGAISVSGFTIGNYFVNNAGATGFPFVGTSTSPSIDVNSLDVTNTGNPGSLTILLSETGFTTLGPTFFEGAIGGTESSTMTINYSDFLDSNNQLFVTTTPIGSALTFNPTAFSGTTSGTLSTTPPYSLTERIVISSTGNNKQASFDAQLTGTPVPEPTSLAIFGTALIGLRLMRRRKTS